MIHKVFINTLWWNFMALETLKTYEAIDHLVRSVVAQAEGAGYHLSFGHNGSSSAESMLEYVAEWNDRSVRSRIPFAVLAAPFSGGNPIKIGFLEFYVGPSNMTHVIYQGHRPSKPEDDGSISYGVRITHMTQFRARVDIMLRRPVPEKEFMNGSPPLGHVVRVPGATYEEQLAALDEMLRRHL